MNFDDLVTTKMSTWKFQTIFRGLCLNFALLTQSISSIAMSSNPFPIFPLYLARLPRIASSSAAASASRPANKGRQVFDHYNFGIKIKKAQTYLLVLPACEDDLPVLAVLVSELSAPASSSSSPHTAS